MYAQFIGRIITHMQEIKHKKAKTVNPENFATVKFSTIYSVAS